MRTVFKAACWLGLALLAGHARAITVFACEPEWAALTRTLLPQATVRSATHHLQDPHHIEARPSLIAQLRNSDLAVCTGAELESAWLPTLQARAGNARVQNGQPGMFYAAEQVELIDPHKGGASAFAGDVHAQGNPHLHADPRRLLTVARALAMRLGQISPAHKATIEQQLPQFERDLNARMAVWAQQANALKGRGVITQHATFGYVWHWLGMSVVADLEPKPGMPPTAAHLEQVLAQAKAKRPMAIVVAQHHDPKPARWLAQQLGGTTPLRVLPATVPDDQPGALLRWLDGLVSELAQTQAAAKP